MRIVKVIGDCPSCNHPNGFGNSFIGGNTLIRGCSVCNYKEQVKLPKLEKKIIYLDQCFYSDIIRNNKQSIFNNLTKTISKLCFLQVVVCPYSLTHVTETHQWRDTRQKELAQFIKSLARGHIFKPHFDIIKSQADRAIKSFIASKPPNLKIKRSDAISSKIDEWDNYIWVNFNIDFGDTDHIRNLKGHIVDGQMNFFDTWKNQNKSFDEILSEEIDGMKNALLNDVSPLMSKYEQFNCSNGIDNCKNEILIDIQGNIPIVERLKHLEAKRLKPVWDFLNSEYFSNIPFVDIYARIFSLFRKNVQDGQFKNKEKSKGKIEGLSFDAEFISAYAPYCDAMFVDKSMFQWLTNKNVNIIANFGVRIFCRSNIESFKGYLDDIQNNISPEHKRLVSDIY